MTDERFAGQVERRLAGLLSPRDAAELSSRLDASEEARGMYLRAVETHLDLGTALDATAPDAERDDRKETNVMARIALNCSCGWNFFIPGSATGYETSCPSCGQSVRIPGRKPGENPAKSAGEVAAEAQQRQGLIRYAILAAAVLIVAGTVGILVARTPAPEPDVQPGARIRPTASTTLPKGTSTLPTTTPASNLQLPPPDPTPKRIDNGPIIAEHKRGVTNDVWLINMTGLVSECLRFRNLSAEWSQLQKEMTTLDGRIKTHLKELAGLGESMIVEKYLLPGDQIFAFAGQDFLTMKYRDAAAFLQQWISRWTPSAPLEQLWFARNDQRDSFYLGILQSTPELNTLVQSPLLAREGTPDDALVVVQVPIPADLIKDISGRFDALPGGYRSLLMAGDRKKLEDLAKRSRAASEDIEWLRSHILGATIPSFQRDADHIRSKVLEYQEKLKENVGSDVIFFKDKRKIEGQIIEQTGEYIKVKGRFGGVKYPMDEIEKIEKGKGVALDFPAKFAEAMKPDAAAGKLEKLNPLLAWCAEKNLSLQKEYVAFVILTQDAAHEGARKTANLPRPK
jgi:hypothetical protein